MTKKLRAYLKILVENKGSDLHVKSGGTIRGRVNGHMIPFSKDKLTYDEGLTLAKELLRGRFGELVRDKSVDFTYKYDEHYRFRVNIFFQVDGVSAVFRTIPTVLPTFDSLKLPEVLKDFCNTPRGLILVTGPTGSGKTTTLASMINQMNSTLKKHIITVEDPVEYEYEDKECIINQRAIGQDALNFSSALRAALREDPDVILVGEMRDLETIETALHAAETGHLVLSTLHTVDAKETINRIIGMFPGEEHNRIMMSLSAVLQGIVSQRLVRTIEGGRRAAIEVLVKNARISQLILEGNDKEITDAIEEGSEIYKSQSFDQALLGLYAEGAITQEEALHNSSTPSDLKLKIDFHDALKVKEAKRQNVGYDKDESASDDFGFDDSDILSLKE
ncbi:MAG: PilT/PilU family type 4a pilus ATPase [Campylobacteraceae bacterium]|nr:PilT/PilU family type 4a pilus ATPase [Campylobacteraceae bacterium]